MSSRENLKAALIVTTRLQEEADAILDKYEEGTHIDLDALSDLYESIAAEANAANVYAAEIVEQLYFIIEADARLAEAANEVSAGIEGLS